MYTLYCPYANKPMTSAINLGDTNCYLGER